MNSITQFFQAALKRPLTKISKSSLVTEMRQILNRKAPLIDPDKTLHDAREDLLLTLSGGDLVSCPCCAGKVKCYRRKIPATGVAWLIWLVRKSGPSKGWIDISDYPDVRGGDYAKVKQWGLVEQKPRVPGQSSKDSGIWRPTDRGVDFVLQQEKIPLYGYFFHGDIFAFSTGEDVDVLTALGNHFDYFDLMNRPL